MRKTPLRDCAHLRGIETHLPDARNDVTLPRRERAPVAQFTASERAQPIEMSKSACVRASVNIAQALETFSNDFWPPRGRGGRVGERETCGRDSVRGQETRAQPVLVDIQGRSRPFLAQRY